MGCCLSSAGIQSETPLSLSAKIISLNGTLRQYPIPVTVAQVLQAETEFMEPPSPSSSSCLICNSDSLYYDSYVLSLDSEHQLQANQIYFVLPSSKFQHRLTASDMAALAVKASVALQNAHGPRRNKARISPLLFVHQSITSNYEDEPSTSASAINSKTLGKLSPPPPPSSKQQYRPGQVARSTSVKRLHKYTSRRTKMAVRSFRSRLSTIYEGTLLL